MLDNSKIIEAKKVAALKALEIIKDPGRLGLGTGSTTEIVIKNLIHKFAVEDFVGIPTSTQTETLAKDLGINLNYNLTPIDYTIDGADWVDPSGNLIKGYGGALSREKSVAEVTNYQIIVVDQSKLCKDFSGKKIPVEVLTFGSDWTKYQIQNLGAKISYRQDTRGEKVLTDNQNYILDCQFDSISNLANLDKQIKLITGVVNTGLFLDLAHITVVGYLDGHVEIKDFKPRSS